MDSGIVGVLAPSDGWTCGRGFGQGNGYKPFKLSMKPKKDWRIQTSNVFATPPDSPAVSLPHTSPLVKFEDKLQRM